MELLEDEAVRVRALRSDLQDQRTVLVKALEGAQALAGGLERLPTGAGAPAQALASLAAGAAQLETGLTADLKFIAGAAIPCAAGRPLGGAGVPGKRQELSQPVEVADPAVRRAFRLLERSTTLKTDPLYPAVRAAWLEPMARSAVSTRAMAISGAAASTGSGPS